MPRGVMVARRILVPPVRVRILPRQQKEIVCRNFSSLNSFVKCELEL